ncbi:hypothetical protein JTB14_013680 [Gonioctena quinquepunctata]|nr:hypothetical protein JTB14_013680 [Gonioctena quinquepunctata]
METENINSRIPTTYNFYIKESNNKNTRYKTREKIEMQKYQVLSEPNTEDPGMDIELTEDHSKEVNEAINKPKGKAPLPPSGQR